MLGHSCILESPKQLEKVLVPCTPQPQLKILWGSGDGGSGFLFFARLFNISAN